MKIWDLLDIILFPLRLIISIVVFPILFINATRGIGTSLYGNDNSQLISFIYRKIKKRRLILFWGNPANSALPKNAEKIFPHIDGLFAFLIPKSVKKRHFKVQIVNENKRKVLEELRKLIRENELSGYKIENFSDFQSKLISIDDRYQTNLFHEIINRRGNFPNFVRSDQIVWEGIFEIYFDAALDAGGVEYFTNIEVKPDLPGKQTIFIRNDLEDSLLGSLVTDSSLKEKLNFHLWRYDKIDREEDSAGIAEKLGDWIYLTDSSSRHFLRLFIHSLSNLDNTKTTENLDFSLRQSLYGLVQAADTELMVRVSLPFKKVIEEKNIAFELDEKSEFGKFLSGAFPPTMAGVARFLDEVRKSESLEKNTIYSEFKIFVEEADYLDFEKLTKKRFIQKLYQIGRLRGSIMHPGRFKTSECVSVISYLLNEEMPGEYFYSIGIDVAY